MNHVEQYEYAMRLLAELNCPDVILEALELWGMIVKSAQVKLHNGNALSGGGIVEGEYREVSASEVCDLDIGESDQINKEE